jgi:hypothetical protein
LENEIGNVWTRGEVFKAMRQDWESETMTKWRAFKVLMVCRATNIARHSVVKDEAEKGALLEYLIERLEMKKE